jgi:F0F1-type ATP synthase assembly protein I
MWTKKEKIRTTLWGLLILCVLVGLAVGLYSLLMKAAHSNENNNLTFTFDEYGYTKTRF